MMMIDYNNMIVNIAAYIGLWFLFVCRAKTKKQAYKFYTFRPLNVWSVVRTGKTTPCSVENPAQ